MVRTRTSRRLILLPVLGTVFIASAPAMKIELGQSCTETVATFKKTDPALEKFFAGAVGYAVFPTIGKGAIGVGAATGKGCVFDGGDLVGEARLSQVTVGLQLGGQSYSELIFFEKAETLKGFKNSDFAFSAQVSAVALKSGAAANAKYRDGVAVFTATKGGLMYEASIGGQKFSYKPWEKKE